jgi:hypothetical protein
MSCVIDKDAPQSGALPAKTKLMFLSPTLAEAARRA